MKIIRLDVEQVTLMVERGFPLPFSWKSLQVRFGSLALETTVGFRKTSDAATSFKGNSTLTLDSFCSSVLASRRKGGRGGEGGHEASM